MTKMIIQPSKHASALGAASVVATFCAGMAMAQSVPSGPLPYGVYDPYGDFSDASAVQIEHLFLPWEDVFLPSLQEADTYAKDRDRDLLVTIEPWTSTRDERNSPRVLQDGIASGGYDDTMRAVCGALGQLDSDMTIRWAQEMDDASGQFIWAGWEPGTYVAAYQRMTNICREEAPRAKYMWSPLGYENMDEYYPGDEYVDTVGLSVFGLQSWEEDILGKTQSFEDILGPRYERALKYNKPIVVAELGFAGDEEYIAAWEETVRSAETMARFPELAAAVYFNQTEVYPWPDGYGMPNWRLREEEVVTN